MTIYYLLLIPVLLSATAKATCQSVVTRDYIKIKQDVIYYNIFMFLFVAVIYLFISWGKVPSSTTMIIAAAYGFFCVLFQSMQTTALSCGPVSLTILIAGFGAVFPVFYGILFLNEELKPVNVVGLAMAVMTMVLSSNVIGTKVGKLNAKWIASTLLAMLSNGAVVTTAKIQKIYSPNEDTAMVFIAYATGTILLTLYYFIIRKKQKKTFLADKKFYLKTFAVSAAMCIYMPLMLIVVGNLPVAVVSPILNIGSAMLIALFGIFLFKDKLTLSQKIGMITGIPAIFLITL